MKKSSQKNNIEMTKEKCTNLTKLENQRLIDILESLKKETTNRDKDINEIISFIKDRKYGLYFEKHIEQVDIDCEKNFLGFVEDVDKKIEVNKSLPYNFLLEGDNLHSLKLLEKTHIKNGKGLIDVIYIDPPYNTKNKDFIYNDKIIGEDDAYRHSKWLSFMETRLKIAYDLLKDDGLIFISIDENELFDLKMIMDNIFGEEFFVASAPRKTSEIIRQNSLASLQNIYDFLLIYRKSENSIFTQKQIGQIDFPYNDGIDDYYLSEFQNSGANGTRKARPNLYYPIYENKDGNLSLEKTNETINTYLPKKVKGEDGRWLWQKSTFEKDKHLLTIDKGTIRVKRYKKTFLEENKDTIKYQSEKLWLENFQNRNGTNLLKNIIGSSSAFNYPKPIELIKWIINLHPNKDAIVLDFFAGSGTTGHAVLELNKEDGGNRKFILCTNNENNICEEITYQRLKTVITGIRKDGSKYSDGLPSNLKYFKTTLIDKNDDDLEDELEKTKLLLKELGKA